MCGIIGIISNRPVCEYLRNGLITLETRGRQSTGLITANTSSTGFGLKIREPGSASDVLSAHSAERDIRASQDNVGVGQTRYATAGNNLRIDAQPIYATRPGVVMAHNGQIVNYTRLRERLESIRGGYTFGTQCDVEALLNAFAYNLGMLAVGRNIDTARFVSEALFPAVKRTLDTDFDFGVMGAYSVVAIIPGRGLLAFKDPNGIRPLCYAEARKGDRVTHVFASETGVIDDILDFAPARELAPGEAVFIDYDLNVYSKVVHEREHKPCIFEPVYFAQAWSELNGMSVQKARMNLGRMIAERFKELKDSVDVVTPVPKSPIPAARALAYAWGIDCSDAIIAKPSHAPSRAFQGGSYEERARTVRDKFGFVKDEIAGKRVAVVDDSVVRGATSEWVNKTLFELGASAVHFFSTFPPYAHICAGGIDVADEEEMLMHGRTIEDARRVIGATTLNFLPLEDTLRAIGLSRENACLGCTTGQYPFDISEYRAFQALRKEQRAGMQ